MRVCPRHWTIAFTAGARLSGYLDAKIGMIIIIVLTFPIGVSEHRPQGRRYGRRCRCVARAQRAILWCRSLCVVRRTGLQLYLQALVEQRNSQLIHHDSGLEDGHQRLSQLLAMADAVLCPVDCVSQDACLRSFGQSLFVRGLNGLT